MVDKKTILDTNAVLRFITGDDAEKSQRVSYYLNNNECIVPIEVIAEAVYNLEKFYMQPRQLIAEVIKDFSSIKVNLVNEENVVRFGCNVFAASSLDFVDCILIAYANVKNNPVFSFDDALNKKLEHNAANRM